MSINVLDLNAVAERINKNRKERDYLKKLFRIIQEGRQLGVLPSPRKTEDRDGSEPKAT